MLIGQYDSKLTDKDRIVVPNKFRQELEKELIVARWYEQCLVLVSQVGWSNLVNRLVGAAELVISPVRDIDRFILGSAFEIKIDSQGRFIVPKILIDYAEIKTEVVFLGLQDRIEIWSRENWEILEESIESKAAEAIEKIAKEGRNAKKY